MMDRISGRPRGFGFVTYTDPEIANKVLEEDNIIDGRAVEVKKTVPKEDMRVKGASKTKNFFIGGLPLSLTEDELKEYFSSYGYVVEHQIMLDQNTGRSRGFVTFSNEETVEKVLSSGSMHELRGKQVEIKRAEPKRAAAEHASENRLHCGGSSSKSFGGVGGSVEGFGGGYVGKMGRGYGRYGGYEGCGEYGKFAGSYGAVPVGFYPGYGGYSYGFVFGAAGYGGSSYGAPAYYGGGIGYASSKGYGISGGGWNDGSKGGYGSGGGKGYGNGGSSSGCGNGGANVYGNSGAANGRFHPYWK